MVNISLTTRIRKMNFSGLKSLIASLHFDLANPMPPRAPFLGILIYVSCMAIPNLVRPVAQDIFSIFALRSYGKQLFCSMPVENTFF